MRHPDLSKEDAKRENEAYYQCEGGMMLASVEYCSEQQAIAKKPLPNMAMISITDSNRPAPLLEGWRYLLRISFPDAEYDEHMLREYGNMLTPFFAINAADARTLRRFIAEVGTNKHIDHLIIHCHAGRSRSAAVAKYVAEQYNLPFDHTYVGYNKTVFQLLDDPDHYDGLFPGTKKKLEKSECSVIQRIRLWLASLL